jgi:hypothetical protein
MTNTEMREALQKAPCTVVFTKLNGEERRMVCTTNTMFIPEEKQPKTNKPPKDDVLCAYDIAKKDWRSFRVENVKEFIA